MNDPITPSPASTEVLAGEVAAQAAGRMSPRTRARIVQGVLYAVLVAAVAAIGFAIDWSTMATKVFNLEVARAMLPQIPRAFGNTLLYAAGAFAIGLTLGVILALMRLSSVAPYRWISTVYVEFFRGIPALLVVMTFGFVIPLALGVRFPTTLSQIAPALGMVSAAYVSETIRAGIQAVPKGQVEAARSLGMSSARTTVDVVIPQAFRIVLPPLTNELILVTKDTSLVFLLGLVPAAFELSRLGRDSISQASQGGFTPIVLIGLCYLLITLPLGFLSRWLEKRTGMKGRTK